MKRMPQIPGEFLKPPETSGDPPGTPLWTPREPQVPPRPQKRAYLNKFTAPEPLDGCIRI